VKLPGRALLLLVIIYLAFLSLGLPDGSFGVAWPMMYPELHLPVGLAGTFMTVGTLFTAISGFSSGWVLGRVRTGPVVLASCIATASGVMLLANARGVLWFYAAAAPLGFGAGTVDAALNGYVARHYSGRHMNWLHACWGIGASAGPVIMGWASREGLGWRAGFLLIGTVQFALAIVFILTLGLWSDVPERTMSADPARAAARTPILAANSEAGWLSTVIFGLYVAVELTTGLWAATVLIVARGFTPAQAALCTAIFYGAITGGRIALGFFAERLGNRRLVAYGGWIAAAGIVLYCVGDNVGVAAVALLLAGVGFAPVYPCLMHEVPRRFAPEAVQTVIGRQSGGASLGAASLPAIAGAVAQFSVAAVPWVVLAVLLAMIACIQRLNRLA
jgi:MFS family permease